MSEMLNWAKREIELACKKENPNRKEGEWDYGCACYESALKAFESLLGDGHSGMSIGFTKSILNRLIDCKPLTPIEDTEDVWNYAFDGNDGDKVYHCKRMSSLFKHVYPDGSVKYSDNDRFISVDVDNDSTWGSGFNNRIAEEYVEPIKFPYMPLDKPIKIYFRDYKLNEEIKGDYDTVHIIRVVKPDGAIYSVDRYFTIDQTIGEFVEITAEKAYSMASKKERNNGETKS